MRLRNWFIRTIKKSDLSTIRASAFGGIADMAGLATCLTRSRMTRSGHPELVRPFRLGCMPPTSAFEYVSGHGWEKSAFRCNGNRNRAETRKLALRL